MLALIPVFFVLLMAYAQYKQAKRNGQWSWIGFLAILGAMGLFIVCVIVPLVQSKTLEAHPGWMMTALFSGILVFVGGVIYAARRISMKTMVKPSADETPKSDKALALLLAAICVMSLSQSARAQGKQVYKDPSGTYSVTVPAGWEAQPQQGSPMVSIVNAKTKVSVTLGIMRGTEANTPTPEKELEGIQSQFPKSCPQAKIEQKGPTKVAGLNGSFLVVRCAGENGPQLMRFTAATKPGVVALIITSSPGDAYLKVLIPLEEIRNSLKVLPAGGASGMGGPQPAVGGEQQQMSAQQEAPQTAGGEFPEPAGAGSGTYRDAQGRFSLAVPAGWNTASDNGNVTLSSGSAWATIVTGSGGSDGGSTPASMSQQIVKQMQAQYKQFQILNEGDFKNNGHAAHGTNATGINPKGERVSVLVVSINAGGSNYLTIISTAPNAQAKEFNGTVMQMAQSVRFAGE